MNAKIKKNSIKAVLYTALILICISWVFPLLFMLLTALRTNEEIRFEGFSFFPKHFTFATFGEVLSNTKSAPVQRKYAEEINAFLRGKGYTKVKLIEAGYKYLKEQAAKDVEDR